MYSLPQMEQRLMDKDDNFNIFYLYIYIYIIITYIIKYKLIIYNNIQL